MQVWSQGEREQIGVVCAIHSDDVLDTLSNAVYVRLRKGRGCWPFVQADQKVREGSAAVSSSRLPLTVFLLSIMTAGILDIPQEYTISFFRNLTL